MTRIYYNDYNAIIADENNKTYRFVSKQEAFEYANQIHVKAVYRLALDLREIALIEQGFEKVSA